MRKRRPTIGHSLALAVPALAVLALAGCMGDENHMEVAYGVVREEVPTRIVVVNDEGKDSRRVTGARQGEPPVLPNWSPDGRRIAFVRYQPAGGPGALDVYVVNADGTGERRLGEGTLPQWTTDGRFLVVERPRGAPPKVSTINVLPVGGGRQRLLTTGSEPTISFRGSRVAFVRHTYRRAGDKFVIATSSLYTIGLDGTGLRRLARIQGPGRFTQPSFLPDDSAVAVIERRGGLGGPLVTHSRDRGRRVIVSDVGETYDWSPKGDLVAYTREGVLYVVRPDGTEVDAFGQSNAIDIEWSPDGKKVAFSVQEILETDVAFVGLYVIEVDDEEGKRRRFVVAEGFAAYLDWAPLPPEDD